MAEPEIVLLVGAGRSGTNFIAHTLARHPGVFNGLENRFIWNIGQRNKHSDWRDPTDATPAIKARIRSALFALAPDSRMIVDKTPGNALRLDFVRAVFPDARIINVIRDGRASLVSRLKMWDGQTTKTGRSRVMQDVHHAKNLIARGHIPTSRLPAFALDSARILLEKACRIPRVEGERIAGLAEIARIHGMETARAVQWRETVTASVMSGRNLPSSVYFEFRYEDLMRHPDETILRLVRFLQLDRPEPVMAAITEKIDPSRADAWKARMPAEDLARLEPVLRPTLTWLGYE